MLYLFPFKLEFIVTI